MIDVSVILNQSWTFPAAEYARSAWSRYAIFVSVCVLGLLIRIGVMHLLLQRTPLGEGRGYIAASIAGILAATLFNFLGSRYVAFSRKGAGA